MTISFMLLIAVVVIIVVAIVMYMSNQNGSAPAPKVHRTLTPQVYQEDFATRQHVLLDVRTAEEFNSGHIPGATNIALPDLPQQMNTLPKDQPIVLYCRSGARSSSAASMLVEAGFEDVHDLGGIIRWQQQGHPVTK
jgi:phage shock protein E